MSTVIKPEPTPVAADPVPAIKDQAFTNVSDGVPVPYSDYEAQHGKPYLVDLYQIGDTWSDPVGGFPKELEVINSYIDQKIHSGEIANSQTAVKDLLKGMEKTNNLTKEERTVVKLGVLSAYVEFLLKQDTIKSNLRKYGNY